jgi:cell division topological specificity factor
MLQELLDRLFSRGISQKTSRETVKHRLKILLAHDRTDLSPAVVEKMRQEILEVLSRYVDIDADGSEFSLESDQRTTVLIANLPIRSVRLEALMDHPPATGTPSPSDSIAFTPEVTPPNSASASGSASDAADRVANPADNSSDPPLNVKSASDQLGELSPDSLDLWLNTVEAPSNSEKPIDRASDFQSDNQ